MLKENRFRFVENRFRFVLVAIFLLLSLYLLYMVISPVWLDVSSLSRKHEALQTDIAAIGLLLAEKENLNNEEPANFWDTAYLAMKDIPCENGLDEVFKELEDVINASSVDIRALRFGKVQRGDKDRIASIPVSIAVAARSNSEEVILDFLEELGELPYLFVIESINFNRGTTELRGNESETGIRLAPESESHLGLNCKLFVKSDSEVDK